MWRILAGIVVLALASCGARGGEYVVTNSPAQPEQAPTVDQLPSADQARVEQYFNPSAPRIEPTETPFGCNPNYSGCVPIASDVDCAGEGDGPAFASDVRVTGRDVYRLDPDGNDRAC